MRKDVLALIGVFILSVALRYNMVLTQVPDNMMIDWGDNWSFLTVVELIKASKHLPVQDLFFGGIPYVYPPISLITYALIYMILPVSYVFISNTLAPIIGSLTVFGIYFLAYSITKNRWVGVLAAYLSLFSPRYLALSSIPIPEMFGHLQAPIFMYLLFNAARSGKRNHALLAGLCGATLFLNHHLTSAILFLTAIVYFVLLTFIRFDLKFIRLLVIVLAVSFLFSSPWWFDTVSKNIMNLVVREQEYAIPPFRDYISMLSPFTFYFGCLAVIFILLKVFLKRGEGEILILAWAGFTLLATQSRHIVRILFSDLVEKHPNLLLVLAPIYGERYFDYMAQGFAVMNAMFLGAAFYWIASKVSLGKSATKIFAISCGVLLVYPTLTFGFGLSNPLTEAVDSAVISSGLGDPYLDISNWALWRMEPDVRDVEEYEASLWMRENLAQNANIIADYPSGEVISAGALRKIAGGAELRVTVDVVGVYSDILVVYYTDEVDEAVKLMKKRNATHVYISERILERGWLPITSHARFPKYSIGSGMKDTNEEKFINSGCFKRVYNKDEIRIYELIC